MPFGRIDILVNNAGIAWRRMAGQDERGRLGRRTPVNLVAVPVPAAAPDDGAEVGPIINISSRLAGRPGTGQLQHEGAVISLNSAPWRWRWPATDHRQLHRPGPRRHLAVSRRPTTREPSRPSRREGWGTPADIGNAVPFFAVDESSYRDRPGPRTSAAAQRGRRMRRGNRWR